jgi:hypothetical protein
MEASETFGAGVESPEDDPFAGSDFGDFGDDATTEGAGEASEAAVPTEGIPVVNAEGERVDPPTAPTDGGQTAQSAEPVKETAEEGAAREAHEKAQREAEADAARKRAAEIADQRKAEGQAIAGGVPEPKIDAVTEAKAEVEQAQDEVSVEPSQAAEVDLNAAEEKLIDAEHEAGEIDEKTARLAEQGTGISSQEAAAAAAQGGSPTSVGASGEEEAPEPEEKKDKKNRVTHRRYIILQVISPGNYKQVYWYEDSNGTMVPRGPGAKRQKIALARDGEGALGVGYAAVGSPPQGAPLVAVAESLFRVVTVAPDEPEPAKRKLKFS